jgi:hypothetical protein
MNSVSLKNAAQGMVRAIFPFPFMETQRMPSLRIDLLRQYLSSSRENYPVDPKQRRVKRTARLCVIGSSPNDAKQKDRKYPI